MSKKGKKKYTVELPVGVPLEEVVADEVEAWLHGLGVTLWGDWDLTRDDRRELAAQWLTRQMIECFGETAVEVLYHAADKRHAR